MKERLAILISGEGTTMQAIIKACRSGKIPIDVACIVSSSVNAGGIKRAKSLGISPKKIIVINPNEFKNTDNKIDQKSFGLKIIEKLRAHKVTIITQNGWLPLTPQVVIDEYENRIFNQHPGPIPDFGGKGMYGRRVHAARLIFTRLIKRDFWTEAIVQKVHKDFDKGIVVKSVKVAILPDDTVEDLRERVLPFEHKIQIELLQDIVRGKVKEQTERKTSVRLDERKILDEAKKIGKLLYPKG
jgi:folate-dependent phosphoribosylglycinamide formyltransferase PurN